jgi:MarR family transcriptional regulator, organic hydroperoxide resistance regulator
MVETDTQRTLHRWRDRKPHDRLAHLVKDAIRMLDRALQRRLAEHGVSIGHWPFLRVLWEADGLTQRELSREAGVMEPTTFAALKAMETLGYVVRRPVAGDRRKRHVFLTPHGQALERRLVPLAMEINTIAVRGAARDDVAATRRTLLRVLENLAADESLSIDGRRRIPSTRELGRRVGQAALDCGRVRK